MPEESEPVDVLEAQITAMTDTRTNLTGLIEKLVRIQSELQSGGFQEFADSVGEPFSALSTATEKLEELIHASEIERNRIRNEE